MISFKRLEPADGARYAQYLQACDNRSCEYSFANLFLWGRKQAAVVGDRLIVRAEVGRRSIYLFPVGTGDVRIALDAILADARARGIPCRICSMTEENCTEVEARYPGAFRFHADRDEFDYLYEIQDLADLKGRKYQKKRNHAHRFWAAHPDCRVVPLDETTIPAALTLLEQWYTERAADTPEVDFYLEQLALRRAFAFYRALELEGLALMDGDQALAFAIGSRLQRDTFDIHFEKAREHADGAYAVINREFARYLREKYPEVRYLNREDDLGLPGLRKAKLSYYPAQLTEKYWAQLREDEDADTKPAT